MDHAFVSTNELGTPSTTDIHEIRQAFHKKRQQPLVVFSTYHSSKLVAEAQKDNDFVFDLAIADEAHRCCNQLSDGLFSTVLDASKIKANKRLFMTATPRFMTARVKERAKEFDYAIASMDNEKQFG